MGKSPGLNSILISDTTLRDGEQMPGATLLPEQKLRLARALADAGVNSIEAGFPACGASEVEAIRAIAREVRGPIIMALCRALPKDIDAACAAFECSNRFRCSVNIFLATSPLHRESKLRRTKQEVLEMIVKSVRYARESFRFVSFSPEDASRTELDFLCEVYREAIDAGASSISFPDTVGILTPDKVRSFICTIQDKVPNIGKVPLAVHFHDDLGLATANTLTAIQEGVRIVQCTVNGLGERAGNTSLEEIAVALSIHQDQFRSRHTLKLERLLALSKLVADETGIPISPHKSIVGSNVFTTEAGVHQDGLLKDLDTYLPFSPTLVGADGVRMVIGKHSGRAAIGVRLREMGISCSAETVEQIVKEIGEVETSKVTDDQTFLLNALERVRRKDAFS